jgi:hypothetical protein
LTWAQNAFSILAPYGFNVFEALAPNIMHEMELGVWKSVLIHLLRILHTMGPGIVVEFNERFRQVPKFGRDAIRNFPGNVSDLKKLAAHDYEDILQCIIPVIEGLIEPHNNAILQLLFTLAQWHALAKLQVHTDATVALLERTTKLLGRRI